MAGPGSSSRLELWLWHLQLPRNRSSPVCREVPAVWESPAGAWPMQGGGTGTHPRAKAAGAEPKGRTCWHDLVWCSTRGSSSPQSKNLSSQGASSAMGGWSIQDNCPGRCWQGVGFICGSRGGFVVWEQLQCAASPALETSQLNAGEENNGSAAVGSHRHCQQHSWNGGRVRQVLLLCFA